jgi:DNA-binding IclR family transcriptional regulator
MSDRRAGGDGTTNDGRTLKSLERSFAIVKQLQDRDGGRVTELAEATGLSKSSVHKHLATLRAGDFVTKDGDTYRLGLRFLDVGSYVRSQFEGTQLAREKLQELAAESGETAQFTVQEHGRAVVLYREAGHRGVFSKGRVGKRFYSHQTAAGKAILAEQSDEAVQSFVDTHGLPAATPETITDPDELFAELDRIRERGFALNLGESTDGLRAVAVSITDPDGDVLGAFAVAGPSHRMKDERLHSEIPDLLHPIVNELELNLAHS